MSFLSSLIYSPFSSHVMAIAIGFVFMFRDLALGTRAKRFQKRKESSVGCETFGDYLATDNQFVSCVYLA